MKRERQIEQMEGARDRLDRRARELVSGTKAKQALEDQAKTLKQVKDAKARADKRARA